MLNKFGHAISSLSFRSPMGLVVGLGYLALFLCHNLLKYDSSKEIFVQQINTTSCQSRLKKYLSSK
jgi:hypothetical protein